MSSRWNEAWAYQRRFMQSEVERIGRLPLNEAHRRLCLHLTSEVAELLDCVDWKLHAREKPPDHYAVIEECVDVWKFLMDVLYIHNVTDDEFLDVFEQKSVVVENRMAIERLKKLYDGSFQTPLFISDLDGVLADRDESMLAYVNDRFVRDFKSVDEMRQTISANEYHEMKDDWYESGGFEKVEVIEEQAAIFREAPGLRMICTSRDVDRYPQLAYQTIEWVKTHFGNAITGVVFAKEKDKALWWVPREGTVAVDDEEDLSRVCTYYRSWTEEVLHATEQQG